MRFERQDYDGESVNIIPSEEGGVFVIDGDSWVGSLHANRAVGRIGLTGLDELEVLRIKAGKASVDELIRRDEKTGSFCLINKIQVGLLAQIDEDTWRSINSFREYSKTQ